MKVGFLSDIHLDNAANKLPNEDVEKTLITSILEKKLDVLVISGDISSHWEDTLGICEAIQHQTNTRVYAVIGNHDIWKSDKKSVYAIEKLSQHPCVLTDQFVHLTKDWSLFGGFGWYDYSFRLDGVSKEDCALRKKELWPDANYVNLEMADDEFVDKKIQHWEKLFRTTPVKNVIFSQHFVPRKEFLSFKKDHYAWNYCNAYIGSEQIGKFISKHTEIKYAPFGHSHTRFGVQKIEGTTFICNPVGYFHEWSSDVFKDQLDECLYTISI